MITIEKSTSPFLFKIGAYSFTIEPEAVKGLAKALTEIDVPKIAAGEISWSENGWKVQFANDDDPKKESRKRILLYRNDLKWHLTQEEALQLGNACRSILG